MFPTTLEIIDYLKNGDAGNVKSGADKLCMDYNVDFVLLRIKHDPNSEPWMWTNIMIEHGLLRGQRYDIAGNVYYIVERLSFRDVHDASVTQVANALVDERTRAVKHFIGKIDKRWESALTQMLEHFEYFWFDWRESNVGYKHNGDVVFFDIVNGLHECVEELECYE